jgi:hypothetical protein
MDKGTTIAGILLALAGLTGLVYGIGINLVGMMARGANDYSFITAYVTEWLLILIAGIVLIATGIRRQ